MAFPSAADRSSPYVPALNLGDWDEWEEYFDDATVSELKEGPWSKVVPQVAGFMWAKIHPWRKLELLGRLQRACQNGNVIIWLALPDDDYFRFLFDEHIHRTSTLASACSVMITWAKSKPEVPLRVTDLLEIDMLDIEKKEAKKVANTAQPSGCSFMTLTSIDDILGIMST